jgi:hypothetical protein
MFRTKLVCVIILAGIAGCDAKLKDSKKESLKAGESREFVIPSGKSDRTVVAEVSASEPVRAAFSGKSEDLVQQKEPSKSFTLECAQKANQELNFEVTCGPKAAEVTINLTSK